MNKLKFVSILLILAIGYVLIYSSSSSRSLLISLATVLSTLTVTPSTSTVSPSTSTVSPSTLTTPPLQYKVAEMNDRLPTFKLATSTGDKPYADGDRAQATVVNWLELPKKCKQDPSLIVVDIGAFYGNIFSYYIFHWKYEIIHNIFLKNHRELSNACVSWSSVKIVCF